MTGSKNSPFSSQDAIVATGLTFAGMAVLQSKLFPAFGRITLSWLDMTFAAKALAWWPVLLIIAGVWVWLKSNSEESKRTNSIQSRGDN